jgi:hypothetical protein
MGKMLGRLFRILVRLFRLLVRFFKIISSIFLNIFECDWKEWKYDQVLILVFEIIKAEMFPKKPQR